MKEKLKNLWSVLKNAGLYGLKKLWWLLKNKWLLLLALVPLWYFFVCVKNLGFRIAEIWIFILLSLFLVLCQLWHDLKPNHPGRALKIIVPLAKGAIALGICLFLVLEGLVVSGMGSKAPQGLDAIIVLGSKVNGTAPSLTLYERIMTAYDYLEENPDTVAVLSGGKGADESISEAECMYRELTMRGIDGGRLLMDDDSYSTAENLRNSFALLSDDMTVGVVTNNFHVFRAVHLAEKIGDRDVSGLAARFHHPLLPFYMVREAFGLAAEVLRGNL